MNTTNLPDNLPLVSIVVITYNSSKYVLETLDSAKNQTYRNLELIVSDDSSKDNTVEVCKLWLEQNGKRFTRTELITTPKNTGIAANVNRGFKAARGEWVKPIAGDDILQNNCISRFVIHTINNPEFSFFFSDMDIFGNDESSDKRNHVREWLDRSLKSFEMIKSPKDQLNKLLKTNNVSSPSAFYKKSAYLDIGGFDEDIKLLEDYPFWINASLKAYTIQSINEELVRYRVNESSVQTSPTYKVAYELFLQKYIFKNYFFRYVAPRINQLNIEQKDLYLCSVLKLTSLHKRTIWYLRKKLRLQ